MTTSPLRTDILVVGAGPAGLHAAFYAAWRGLSVTLLEASGEPGGQLAALYPDKRVYDVPGLPGARAAEVVTGLIRQLDGLPVTLRLNEVARTLRREGTGWIIDTYRGTYSAGAVILAAGLGALLPRSPQLPPGVHPDIRTTVPEPSSLLGRRVLIVGGVPQATRAALELAEAGIDVTLTHRRTGFRGSPAQLSRLTELRELHRLRVLSPAHLDGLHADGARLSLADGLLDVPADTVILLGGVLPDLSPLQGWPLAWDGEYVPDGLGGTTSLDGVYVAGDLARSSSDFKLISVGLAQAAVAANHAVHHVRPDLKVRPGHSSERRVSGS